MCIYVVVPNIIPLEPMGLLRYQFQSFTTNVWGLFLSTGSLQSLPLQKSFSKAQLSHESGDVHLEKKNIHSSPQKRTNLPTIPSRKRFVSSKLQKQTFLTTRKAERISKWCFLSKKMEKKTWDLPPDPGCQSPPGLLSLQPSFSQFASWRFGAKSSPFLDMQILTWKNGQS